ncbi:MAG: hypothetical protein C0613_11095 [Desulfobulbaceae bacterium]|nr:MAG: hypothetical protein C0613_11095 [Desulfobulbaceae bacterium]
MKIIEADESHIAYLADFGSTSFIHAYQCTLPLQELQKYIKIAFSEATLREEINGSLATYFICEDPGQAPCGYAKLISSPPPSCLHATSGIELQRLYVASAYRGQGVGRLLMSHAESYARKRHRGDLWLRVWDGNVVARDIYAQWGFATVGRELYQVGEEQRTVLVMGKSLDV